MLGQNTTLAISIPYSRRICIQNHCDCAYTPESMKENPVTSDPHPLAVSELSDDHPLHHCRQELEALYHVIHCRYQDDSELSDRSIVLGHLKRLMMSLCAPTLRERFDENNVWLNPKTDQYMEEVRRMFDKEPDDNG
ncbi:hypothetical protein CLV84_2115 [Neolewinella xylanilytica]|uniref:Uncharacterized protein n=2 Tax=Neolewinella xylanilytica TaxID=1514080 RepID=A0A2S6I251_9BACT|nr:hypothetical protein CLV84_2115 [Neolewinella xylanilytica]